MEPLRAPSIGLGWWGCTLAANAREGLEATAVLEGIVESANSRSVLDLERVEAQKWEAA